MTCTVFDEVKSELENSFILGFKSYTRNQLFRMQYPGYLSNNYTIPENASHAEQVLDRVKKGIRMKMDKVLDTYLTGGDSDFPPCDSPVWIFGRSYSVNYGMHAYMRVFCSLKLDGM